MWAVHSWEYPHFYSPRWPVSMLHGSKMKAKERRWRLCLSLKNISWHCHQTCLLVVYWPEYMTSTCPHPSGRGAGNMSCLWQALGHCREEKMGANEEMKLKWRCHCEEENKGKETSKLGKLCPISLILHISIKAYWKLKLLWNVQEAVHNKHSKYIVNSKQNKNTVSKKHVFTYLFIRKNVYS